MFAVELAPGDERPGALTDPRLHGALCARGAGGAAHGARPGTLL